MPTTTQGDIIVRGASTNERLAIGTAGQVLKVNGSGNGLTYGIGGGITQVIQASDTTTGSLNLGVFNTYYDIPNLSVTITPASSSSKFFGTVFKLWVRQMEEVHTLMAFNLNVLSQVEQQL